MPASYRAGTLPTSHPPKETSMSEKKDAALKRAGFLEALLAERQGYVNQGKAHRVAEVDEQIKAYGGEVPAERRAPRQTSAAKSES